jgi:hypothetical protein
LRIPTWILPILRNAALVFALRKVTEMPPAAIYISAGETGVLHFGDLETAATIVAPAVGRSWSSLCRSIDRSNPSRSWEAVVLRSASSLVAAAARREWRERRAAARRPHLD